MAVGFFFCWLVGCCFACINSECDDAFIKRQEGSVIVFFYVRLYIRLLANAMRAALVGDMQLKRLLVGHF